MVDGFGCVSLLLRSSTALMSSWDQNPPSAVRLFSILVFDYRTVLFNNNSVVIDGYCC